MVNLSQKIMCSLRICFTKHWVQRTKCNINFPGFLLIQEPLNMRSSQSYMPICFLEIFTSQFRFPIPQTHISCMKYLCFFYLKPKANSFIITGTCNNCNTFYYNPLSARNKNHIFICLYIIRKNVYDIIILFFPFQNIPIINDQYAYV